MFKKFYKLLMVLVPLFALMGAQNLQAQEMTVTGNVSEMDLPGGLPGVNVIIQGTTQGTVTSVEGDYSITVPAAESVLVFSSVGYISEERTVGNQSTINVTLVPDITSMEEVVVVGYGTTKKVNLTGAVDVIKADRLETRPIANAGEGLQGLSPNLNVTVLSGDPTVAPELNIRGFESINGGAPLVLVDNVPMDLNNINPEDIESISVLKDGAASAIYGARAAFGVVLVTTKKGTKGMQIRGSSMFTWKQPIFHRDPITNVYDYAVEENRIVGREGDPPIHDEETLERLRNYWDDPANQPAYDVINGTFVRFDNENLAEELLSGTSPQQKYDVSISGASDNASYYSSFGYLRTDGFWNHPGNNKFERYNALVKGDFKVTDWMSFEQQVNVNLTRNDEPSDADINSLIRQSPFRFHRVPLIPGYEELEGKYWNHGLMLLPQLENGGRKTMKENDVWLKSGITIRPLKRLSIKTDFAYNIFFRDDQKAFPLYETIIPDQLDDPIRLVGQDKIETERRNDQRYVFNAFAEYLITDFENHNIKAMIGFNQEWLNFSSISADRRTFYSPTVPNLAATYGIPEIDGNTNQNTIRGAFYRLNYSYKDRYLVEANGRYDGTSRFSTADRFGFFPSVSVGWRISEEPFMAATRSVIDNLKIRASYGTLGNQSIRQYNSRNQDYYPYISTLNPNNSSQFLLNSGTQMPYVNLPNLISPTLTWETVNTKNIALDVAMLGNRLEASFDVYERETLDMLLRRSYPDVLGQAAPPENGADLSTKGWEVSLKWRDEVGKNLSYYADFNLADWKTKITRYDNPTGAIGDGEGDLRADANDVDFYEGMTIGEVWGYETNGIIQTEEQLAGIPDQSYLSGDAWLVGDIEYVDQNGDGKVDEGINTLSDPGDRKVIGNTTPRYSFGLNAGINYKGITLDVFFQGVGKRDYMPEAGSWTWFFPWRSEGADKSWITDTWREDNRGAYFPAASKDPRNFKTSTQYIQDASYIRLKNISLGYNFPKSMIDRVGLGNLRVYVTGMNLWTLSNIRKPLDPEYVYDRSIDYPLFVSYTAGIVIGL